MRKSSVIPPPKTLSGSANVLAPDSVESSLLALLADQSARVPWILFATLVVMAIVAAGRVPFWIPVMWLGASGVLLLMRRKVLAWLPTREELAMPERVRLAFNLSLINGLMHASFLAVFPFLSEPERAMFTLLLIAVCTGTVGTTAGHRRIFLAYVLPIMTTLAALWIWSPGVSNPGFSERSIGFLLFGYLWILLGLARAAWATFSESVNIRFQEHRLNARLQDALENANKANEAKTRFLASASHDLRQPLHTIGMLVAALSLRPLAGREREIVDVLTLVTESLTEQLDGLLDISKLDAGVVQTEIATFDLGVLVTDLFNSHRGLIVQKGLAAKSRCDASVWVDSDAGLVTRVIRNLIDNAIKFTDKGFISIELISAKGRAVVTILDSGRGMAQDQQDKVFEEFYQIGNPERDRSRGLGLGLSIVRRLADLIGMTMVMTSNLGEGTKFELQLPLATSPLRPLTGSAQSPELGRIRRHVLLVDDERHVRLGLRLVLEEIGCTCSEAGTIDEALRQSTLRRPDIVLSDLRLRGNENGIEAISRLRQLLGPVPALLISGDTAADRLQEAQRAGIQLLHKPLSVHILQQEIQRALLQK